MVATAATPVLVVSASASAAVVAVATPVVLVVIAVPAVAVLLMAAGAWLLRVALISAAAVHLGRLLSIRGVIMLPRAPSARISTCGQLPLLRRGEAAVQLIKLLHVELPHRVVHLRMKKETDNRMMTGAKNHVAFAISTMQCARFLICVTESGGTFELLLKFETVQPTVITFI